MKNPVASGEDLSALAEIGRLRWSCRPSVSVRSTAPSQDMSVIKDRIPTLAAISAADRAFSWRSANLMPLQDSHNLLGLELVLHVLRTEHGLRKRS